MTRPAVVVAVIVTVVLLLAVLDAVMHPGDTTVYQLGHGAPPTYPPGFEAYDHVALVDPADATTTTTTARSKRRGNPAGNVNGHPCGGDLPPCWVLRRESGGDPNAYNPTGCYEAPGRVGCRGKWQCSTSTCSGTGSEAEQDAEARRVWDHGRGCSHWAACA